MIVPELLESIELERLVIKVRYKDEGNKRVPTLLIPRISKRSLSLKYPDKDENEIEELHSSLKREVLKARIILNQWNKLPSYCDKQGAYNKIIKVITGEELVVLSIKSDEEIKNYLNKLI